ncbi:LRAT-like domain-containing protein [Strongyloides ratti]|uniref:LRAT-like domain-containing protein n=1 Tax=Strongyloides ratti TaxID=34506 RepID=A0A090L188_STRRB|nr:LRAT-like domain-containing protein [Strongyloides ratti]CEF61882.1 LRAT-like domain-containing protein [Strongyloides ratti]
MIFGLLEIPLLDDALNYIKKVTFDLFLYRKLEFDDKLYTNDEINKPNKRSIKTKIIKISELKKIMKPGDMIEFESYILGLKTYGHWGIFLGIKENQYILIHMARELIKKNVPSYWNQFTNIFQQNDGQMSIHLTNLENAAFSDQTGRINNYLDNEKTPNSAKYIREIAAKALKKEIDYCLITNNCEHFVTELRYNEKISLQSKPIQVIITIYKIVTDFSYKYLYYKI